MRAGQSSSAVCKTSATTAHDLTQASLQLLKAQKNPLPNPEGHEDSTSSSATTPHRELAQDVGLQHLGQRALDELDRHVPPAAQVLEVPRVAGAALA